MKVTRLRHEIYLMLVGRAYAQQIALKTNLKHQNIQYHIKELVRNGIIKKQGDKRSYPLFYDKGPNAAVFEEAASRFSSENKKHGTYGTVVRTSPNRRSRTHVKGSVRSIVLKVGEMHTIHTDTGEIVLFPDPPYNTQNGNEFFKGTIDLDGIHIKIQFHRTSKGNAWFYVWPSAVMQTAGEVSDYPKEWEEQAKRIQNVLSKYGGWRFALPMSLIGEPHFALREDAWFDRSTGKLESETTDAKIMYYWLTIDKLVERFESLERTVGELASTVAELVKKDAIPIPVSAPELAVSSEATA